MTKWWSCLKTRYGILSNKASAKLTSFELRFAPISFPIPSRIKRFLLVRLGGINLAGAPHSRSVFTNNIFLFILLITRWTSSNIWKGCRNRSRRAFLESIARHQFGLHCSSDYLVLRWDHEHTRHLGNNLRFKSHPLWSLIARSTGFARVNRRVSAPLNVMSSGVVILFKTGRKFKVRYFINIAFKIMLYWVPKSLE
jgi:hypothetical protein